MQIVQTFPIILYIRILSFLKPVHQQTIQIGRSVKPQDRSGKGDHKKSGFYRDVEPERFEPDDAVRNVDAGRPEQDDKNRSPAERLEAHLVPRIEELDEVVDKKGKCGGHCGAFDAVNGNQQVV